MVSGFACPVCGRIQRFSDPMANQRVMCSGCRRMLVAPVNAGEPATLCADLIEQTADPRNVGYVLPPVDAEHADYDVELPEGVAAAPAEPPPSVTLTRCPSCGCSLGEKAVLCLNCGYHVGQGSAIRTQVEARPADAMGCDPAEPPLPDARPWESPLRHVYSPVALTVVGVLLIWLNTLIIFDPTPFGGNPSTLRLQYLIGQFFAVMMQLPFLCAGLVVLWLFGTRFRHLSLAVLKMIALVVLATAVTGCAASVSQRLGLGTHLWHMPFTWAIGLATFWAVATWLFELRVIETLVLYLVTVLAPVQVATVIFEQITIRL
jgi:hypothetical protein